MAQQKGKNIALEVMVSIFDLPIRVLFDTGASHTFISSSLLDRLGISPDIIYDSMIVSNTMGDRHLFLCYVVVLDFLTEIFGFLVMLMYSGFLNMI